MIRSNSPHMWHADVLLDREVDFIPYLPRRDILRQPSTRLEEDMLIASIWTKTQPPQRRPCRPPKGRREEREERPPPPMPWRSAAALRAAADALDATHGPLCRWCCNSCSYCNSIFHRDCMLCQTPRDAAVSLVTCLCIPSSSAARAGSMAPAVGEAFLTGHALSSSGISERLQRLTAVTLPHLIGTASSLEVASATLSVLLAAIRRALNAPKTACVLSSAEVAAVLHAPGGVSLLEDLGFVDDDGGVVARPPCRSAQDVSLLRALGSLLARSQPTPTEQALGRRLGDRLGDRDLLRSLRRVDPRDHPRDHPREGTQRETSLLSGEAREGRMHADKGETPQAVASRGWPEAPRPGVVEGTSCRADGCGDEGRRVVPGTPWPEAASELETTFWTKLDASYLRAARACLLPLRRPRQARRRSWAQASASRAWQPTWYCWRIQTVIRRNARRRRTARLLCG